MYLEVEVSRRPTACSGASLPSEADLAAVGDPRRDLYGEARRGLPLGALDSQLELAPADGGAEIDLDPFAQIVPWHGAVRGASSTGPRTSEGVPEDLAEDVAEIDGPSPSIAFEPPKVEASPWSSLRSGAILSERRCFLGIPAELRCVHPEFVVEGSLLRVGEDLEGVVDLFELLLRCFISRVDVGVVFAGELAIGRFEFLR